MVDLENLKVSLTKNGYLKIATLVARHDSRTVLEHTYGSHPGINLIRSQVANILCADHSTEVVPGFWDEIRTNDRGVVRAFTFLAIVFAHRRLIQAFREAGRGSPEGTLFRNEMSEKEYTNLQFAMSEVDMCDYARGTDQVAYDWAPVLGRLRSLGPLVGKLLAAKIRRCGWRDPEQFLVGSDLPLVQQCLRERFNEVIGMPARQFDRWISGRPTQPR